MLALWMPRLRHARLWATGGPTAHPTPKCEPRPPPAIILGGALPALTLSSHTTAAPDLELFRFS